MQRPPYVIVGLPRSRTTWLSRFLSYRDWHCGHDEAQRFRQLEDVRSWLAQPNTGTVETAVAPFWRLLRHMRPDVRVLVIRRDPSDAVQSAIAAGLAVDREAATALFQRLDAKLRQISGRLDALTIRYEDLREEHTCAALFEHLLPYAHDHGRWARLNEEVVQTDVQALRRYVAAHAVQLERLSDIARQKSLALLASGKVVTGAALTLGFDPFADFLRDGRSALENHCADIGEHPGGWTAKNLTGLQMLEDTGRLQVTTARSNGRVFGYLLTTIGESLEARGRPWACHTAFYASPDWPGLGMKLQRKAAEGLRARGVHEVVMRAGVRGSGERVAALYKRLGAEPFGSYYRLQLGEAA